MSSSAPLNRIFSRYLHIFHHLKRRHENYYDILKVKKDCSSQDIKDAFVKLSKQHHPDLSGHKRSAEFIKINEAYQTLIKPKLRKDYDNSINLRGGRPRETFYYRGGDSDPIFRPWDVKPDIDPNPSQHYYGVNGVRRISNFKIALYLLALCITGAIFGFVSVKHSYTFSQKELDKKSAEASRHLQSVVEDAKKYGNEEQLKRMVERMIKSS